MDTETPKEEKPSAVQEAQQPAAVPAQPSATHPELQALRDYVMTRGASILLPVAVAAVVILGVFLYKHQSAAKVQRAAALLDNVRTLANLQEIVTQYPKTPSAQIAMLMLAKAYYDSGNYGMADSTYAQFETQYPKHPMLLNAKLGRIHVLEAVGQTEQALAAFTDFVKQTPQDYLTPLAIFGKARCLEQLGRTGEARAIYEDFIAANAESDWLPEAEANIKTLEKLHPVGAKPVLRPMVSPAPPLATGPTNS